MWMLSGITRKQWVNLTVIFLMSVFSVYFVVYVIKPVERFTQSRDATRLSSVNTIKSALETYVATYKTIPACETISAAICPVSYVLDGADPVSKLLVDSKSLSTIPKQPVGTNNPFCEYRVFMYEADGVWNHGLPKMLPVQWNKVDSVLGLALETLRFASPVRIFH